MLSAIESSSEILPGYVLVDRLGSGGYAEVWRASAPGGLFKAIKIVHGFYDEELAAQEMKAMERIKDVRHPFLLSLERFDVVDGRLVILTELADKSLEQRACECRAQGLAGIPRDELIGYLDDAAEALDYLIEKKSLLHLDVKPENLLLLGEHLKVADFGLVKEFASRTQKSMIAGMTPTFAAPEMFDDHPSQRSDQYSLAIVYQLMLTGTLPFPGRTAAQLAKQHTLAAPQLASLPTADRDVIARALAKNPDHRFPNCRALMAALRSTPQAKSSAAPPAAPSTKAALPAPPSGATVAKQPSEQGDTDRETDRGSHDATLPRQADPPPRITQHFGKAGVSAVESPAVRQPVSLTEEQVVDVAAPEVPVEPSATLPTLTVAVGGVATRLLGRLLEVETQLEEVSCGSRAQLAIDTDRQELKKCCVMGDTASLTSDDTLHLPLRLPKDYDPIRKQLDWLSRRWLYNIPRSLETRGYRPLGRLALVDHLDKVLRAIEARMTSLASSAAGEQQPDAPGPLRVVLLAGMGGGTGSGMVIDLAYAIRHVAAQIGAKVSIEGVLIGCPLATPSGSGLATANMFALLGELRQVTVNGNQGSLSEGAAAHPLEGSRGPFDAVYLVAHPSGADASAALAQIDNVASYLARSRRHPLSDWRRACHAEPTPQEAGSAEPLQLRSLAFVSLSQALESQRSTAAQRLREAVWRLWLAPGNPLPRHSQPGGAESPGDVEDPTLESEAATPLPRREERLRLRFQESAVTRFAEDVAAELAALWPPQGGEESASEDPRVISGIKRLAGALELKFQEVASDPQHLAAAASLVAENVETQVLARRVLHQLMAMPKWNTFDAMQCLAAIDQLLLTECTAAVGSQDDPGQAKLLAKQALEHANAAVLSCGFDRRTLAMLPSMPGFDGAADSIAAARPQAIVCRGPSAEGWIAVEASGIAAQSLAARMAHVYPDIAEAADRLHTRIDIVWEDPLDSHASAS